ncbi:hypothetical protein TanjilG_18559 [Lupinus angustifolius]|uniref:MAPK kinase substrate protein n=1 Tax=Lupinus angustifolius TaxID=3871 RepID=A0A4P1RXH0_LUPAN|nr:PREDICTED: uncharacterized protein At1g15400-like [Lupinus angustifolius]OIW19749.1 hypothetical protein TanjilG_18559 [Lupinus angustifolius]
MADTGLQRSITSFRRQGSSGLVWDDKFIQNLNQNQNEENQRVEREGNSEGPSDTLMEARPYRTVNVAEPSIDPPSPKVATCGLCGFFWKKKSVHESKPKSRKRR